MCKLVDKLEDRSVSYVMKKIFAIILISLLYTNVYALPKCPGEKRIISKWINCTGSYKAIDGHSYSGDFDSNGNYGGNGVLITKEGGKLEGQFLKGKLNGKGKQTFMKGNTKITYEGDWFMGNWHGKGKLWTDDGVFSYEGDFQNMEMTGYGTLKFKGNTQTGKWKNGELVK